MTVAPLLGQCQNASVKIACALRFLSSSLVVETLSERRGGGSQYWSGSESANERRGGGGCLAGSKRPSRTLMRDIIRCLTDEPETTIRFDAKTMHSAKQGQVTTAANGRGQRQCLEAQQKPTRPLWTALRLFGLLATWPQRKRKGGRGGGCCLQIKDARYLALRTDRYDGPRWWLRRDYTMPGKQVK